MTTNAPRRRPIILKEGETRDDVDSEGRAVIRPIHPPPPPPPPAKYYGCGCCRDK